MKKLNPVRATSSRIISAEAAWPACLLTAVCCVAIVWALLDLNSEMLHVPLGYAGDSFAHLSIAKNISSGNWWWNNPRLGMPLGADWRDFPMYLTIDYAVIRILSLIFHDPFISLNLCWLLTILATSVFATFVFVRMRIDRAVSVCLGLVYAMQPYAWLRNVGHFNLMFYLVPLLCGFIVKTTTDEIDAAEVDTRPWWRRIPVWVYFAAAAQGLSYAYNSFFSCFFLVMGGLIVLVVRRSLRPALPFAVITAVIVLFFAINLSPSYVYWAKQGQNPELVQKSAMESDFYGMKLRYLLLPILDHRVPILRRLALGFDGAFPPENESGSARLGLVGAIGFLYLLWTCLYGLFRKQAPRDTVFRVLACLALMCVLLSVVGGFGTIFNTLVSPDVRAYNRTVTYISFFSVAAIAILLTRLKRRLGERGVSPLLLNSGLALLAVLAILDESPTRFLRIYKSRSEPFYADRDFGVKLEAAFPSGAKIFQLPHTGFPIDSQPNGLALYSNCLPYLHTTTLKWSWGAFEGRNFQWGTTMSSLPTDAMIGGLTRAGFAGILVAADGYPDPTKVLGPLTKALGSPILFNAYRHQYVFDLRPQLEMSRKTVQPMNDLVMVRDLYQDFFASQPDRAAVETAARKLKEGKESRAQLASEYLSSQPFREAGLFVATCYLAFFDREPDLAGWEHWTVSLRDHQLSKIKVVETFLTAPESVQHFGAKASPELLALLYRQERVAPGPQLQTDAACLDSKKCSLPAVLEQTLSRPEFQTSTLDRLHMKLLYFVLLGQDPGSVDAPRPHASEEADKSDREVIESILGSKEYAARHPVSQVP